MKSSELLAKHPQFELPLSYCAVGPDRDSTICFYNFYDQIFPDQQIVTDLYLSFFGEDGTELKTVVQEVPCHGSVQIDASQFVDCMSGMVGVMAVPRAELSELAKNRFPLKSKIGTGYYMVWREGQGQRADMSHEWSPLAESQLGEKEWYVGYSPSRVALERGIILMNICGIEKEESISRPVIEALGQRRQVLGSTRVEPLRSLATKVLTLKDLFADIEGWLKEGVVTLRVRGKNLALPLTVERHPEGDFHIHHG
jgi:hypothetical protein